MIIQSQFPMAALGSCVPCVSLPLHAPAVPPRRRGSSPPATAASALHRRCLLPGGSATSSSGTSNALFFFFFFFFPVVRRASARVSAVDPGSAAGFDLSGFNLPVPPWAQWLVGAIVVAIPAYRQFRAMEDKLEKTAEVAIEVIDKVAEETEKIADEDADAFPGNETLKKAAANIKAVADEIEEDADKAEALIEKLDWRMRIH
ncbi:uncharacterized protein LOC120641181 isoform X2 [Panicum virgatum]|uniref:uncharacterized protein LOC120641181 isoform X2 n=1 Tax=Panicum virgatum TaxID=38727 RepID=UPI0019D51E4E|nr:uncharacterized protein LOC120641181 isoform X2 [Panicum virgatum]